MMGRNGDAKRNQRSRNIAKAAFRLRRDQGLTNQQIAEQLGLDPQVVPARVKLGERLADADL